jgi:tRNA threonylcarbamoyl adenosine modification protein YjeE
MASVDGGTVRGVQQEKVRLADAEATEALGGSLAEKLRSGDVVLLEGPLGTGKTTLVRGLVAALDGNPAEVCSPTFVLLESYEVRSGGIQCVHHADLYRLRGITSAPWDEVGLGEALDDSTAVTAVEWPEELGWEPLPGRRILRVTLAFAEPSGRTATVTWLSR